MSPELWQKTELVRRQVKSIIMLLQVQDRGRNEMGRMPSMHCWRITGSLLTQEIPFLYSSHGDPHTSRNHCRSVPKKASFIVLRVIQLRQSATRDCIFRSRLIGPEQAIC